LDKQQDPDSKQANQKTSKIIQTQEAKSLPLRKLDPAKWLGLFRFL
jgi:hypothetical protein